MTHKENLKAILEVHFAGFKDELIESAVKRIMQLKYEKSHDCLDREYLFQVLDDFCGCDRGATITLDTLADLVADMPSVQPGQKTGHWEWVQYDYNPKLGNWHCSECRCVFLEFVEKNEKSNIPLYKYCPQCGAKMAGSEEQA